MTVEASEYRVEYRERTKLWVVIKVTTGRVVAVKDTEKAAQMTAKKEGRKTGRKSGWAASGGRGE